VQRELGFTSRVKEGRKEAERLKRPGTDGKKGIYQVGSGHSCCSHAMCLSALSLSLSRKP